MLGFYFKFVIAPITRIILVAKLAPITSKNYIGCKTGTVYYVQGKMHEYENARIVYYAG